MTVLIVERPEEAVLMLRINRPETRNALNLELRRALADTVAAAGTDDGVRCIVMTGNEKAFAAGADIKEMTDLTPVDTYVRGTDQYWKTIAACPKPIVAAINGYALGGGCELAMLCDIIVAGTGARFGLPEVKLGILPGAGGTQRLPRAVGKFKAMRMVLTGDLVSAADADAMGLVSEVVADDQVVPKALEIARSIAGLSPLAVRQIKETVLRGMDAPLDTGLALERKAFQFLFATEDQKEGMAAFIGKRKAVFKGR
jgi:enoyl-CoA hydratase/carnithine racemase